MRGYKELARQYGRMYSLFHDADEDLKLFEHNEDFDSFEKTIQELGGEVRGLSCELDPLWDTARGR